MIAWFWMSWMRNICNGCLLLLALILSPGQATAAKWRTLLHRVPLAGAQFHQLGELASRIRVGDALVLAREPGNRHDPRAIRVEWQGHLLGYVPRSENAVLAVAMDEGERLSGRVVRISDEADPWRRLELEIYFEF